MACHDDAALLFGLCHALTPLYFLATHDGSLFESGVDGRRSVDRSIITMRPMTFSPWAGMSVNRGELRALASLMQSSFNVFVALL